MHRGFSFVRIIQRCPEWLPKMFEPWLHDPSARRCSSRIATGSRSRRSSRARTEPGRARSGRTSIAPARSRRRATRSRSASCTTTPRAVLRGPAPRRPDAHGRPDPRRPRGRARQVHRVAARGRRVSHGHRHSNSREQRLFFLTSRLEGDGSSASTVWPCAPRFSPAITTSRRFATTTRSCSSTTGPQKGVVRSLSRHRRRSPARGRAARHRRREAAPPRAAPRARDRDGSSARGAHVQRCSRPGRTLRRASARPTTRASKRSSRPSATKLDLDGDVVDCEPPPYRACSGTSGRPSRSARPAHSARSSSRLVVRLSDILRAAFIHSGGGPRARDVAQRRRRRASRRFRLRTSCRSSSSRRAPKDELAPARRTRIEWALATLAQQRFYPDPRLADRAGRAGTLRVRLRQLRGRRRRVPRAAARDGRGDEGDRHRRARGRQTATSRRRHDAFFATSTSSALDGGRPRPLPRLSRLHPARAQRGAGERQPDGDAVVGAAGQGAGGSRRPARGSRDRRRPLRVRRAQRAARHHRDRARRRVRRADAERRTCSALRERIKRASRIAVPRSSACMPARRAPAASLPAYLTAAAALDSRAFPAFSYDPYAGDNQAARFSLEDNPQPEAGLAGRCRSSTPTRRPARERRAWHSPSPTSCCATARYAAHFARVPRERWNARMVPVADWLARDAQAATACVPYVSAVDRRRRAASRAGRPAAGQRRRAAAARCGIACRSKAAFTTRMPSVARAREGERGTRRRQRSRASSGRRSRRGAGKAPRPRTPAPAAAAKPSEPPSATADEAWIETSRCPSCNECQLINDRMFLYNENKQAYIGDVKAGTYRQMVEAAESCQVSIIHPGKPWNPNEPGLAGADRARATRSSRFDETIMTETLARWHDDHVHFAKLLDFLDSAARPLPRRRHAGLRAHARHHVLHDALPRRAAPSEGGPGLREHPGARAEHRDGRRRPRAPARGAPSQRRRAGGRTRRHRQRLDRVTRERRRPGAEYVAAFRSHMDIEEEKILPLAARLLGESDWNAMTTAIGHIEDPLFGLNPSERYAALEEHLGRQVTAAP